MSSRPTRSPHFSNTAIEDSPALPAENASHFQDCDSSDYAFDPDKSDFGLAANASPSSLHRKAPLWRRAVAALSPSFANKQTPSADATPLLSPTGTPLGSPKRRRRRLRLCRCFVYSLLGFFAMLGLIQFVAIACGIFISFFPDDFDRATDRWRHHHTTNDSISHWPTDISKDITPVQCHSHNDYWRRVPLFSALQAGCIGVEADVWLLDEDLYVGHSSSSLTPQRTLQSMYIKPLLDILDRQNPITQFHPAPDNPLNGVFDTDPSQTLVLLIDFKTDGVATWDYVVAQLAPLRERNYLSYFNGSAIVPGPITIVGTGNTPFNLVTVNSTYRDIFFDAPLELLADDNTTTNTSTRRQTPTVTTTTATGENKNNNVGQGLTNLPPSAAGPTPFNWTNSYYASVSFDKSIGPPWTTLHLSERQIDTMRAQIRGAHRHGLRVRYWSLPSWPRSLRNHLWSVLVREGVDILNVDDLESATKGEWRSVGDWWGW